MTSIPITPGSKITLHFSLSLVNGDTIDSNFESSPASFQLGDGSMLPGFEACLLGLRAGAEIEKIISAAEGFGKVNEHNVHRIAKDKFTLFLDDEYDSLEQGVIVSFKDPAGFDLPGVVKEKSEFSVLIDFNHPLAGKDIVFKAKIVSVIAGTTEKVELKL